MFDMGFLELLLIAVVALLVIGPERLPGVVRTVAGAVSKVRNFSNGIRDELEREANLAEIRQELQQQSDNVKQQVSSIESQFDVLTDPVKPNEVADESSKLGNNRSEAEKLAGLKAGSEADFMAKLKAQSEGRSE